MEIKRNVRRRRTNKRTHTIINQQMSHIKSMFLRILLDLRSHLCVNWKRLPADANKWKIALFSHPTHHNLLA